MYIKIAATDTEKARILFYYDRATLFEGVALLSNYMSKNLATKEGVSLTDDFALSDDERDLFYACVKSCLPDIYEAMAKITNSVIPAFYDSLVVSTPIEGTDVAGNTKSVPAGTYVAIYILDNAAYNGNIVTLVDASIENTLKPGVLRDVYATVVQPDLLKLSGERFDAELIKLKQRLYQLKKKSRVADVIGEY